MCCHSFCNSIASGLPVSCCCYTTWSWFTLVAINQHGPCHSCNLVWDVCDMLSGIMLLLTQSFVIGNYMRNIQAASCFSLSVTIRSFTHMRAHMYVCMYVCMCVYICVYMCTYVYWGVQCILAIWLKDWTLKFFSVLQYCEVYVGITG